MHCLFLFMFSFQSSTVILFLFFHWAFFIVLALLQSPKTPAKNVLLKMDATLTHMAYEVVPVNGMPKARYEWLGLWKWCYLVWTLVTRHCSQMQKYINSWSFQNAWLRCPVYHTYKCSFPEAKFWWHCSFCWCPKIHDRLYFNNRNMTWSCTSTRL